MYTSPVLTCCTGTRTSTVSPLCTLRVVPVVNPGCVVLCVRGLWICALSGFSVTVPWNWTDVIRAGPAALWIERRVAYTSYAGRYNALYPVYAFVIENSNGCPFDTPLTVHVSHVVPLRASSAASTDPKTWSSALKGRYSGSATCVVAVCVWPVSRVSIELDSVVSCGRLPSTPRIPFRRSWSSSPRRRPMLAILNGCPPRTVATTVPSSIAPLGPPPSNRKG